MTLNIWEGLTTTHPETAEAIEGAACLPPKVSNAGLRYEFTIRDEAGWSNGDPVRADDFVRGCLVVLVEFQQFVEHVAAIDPVGVLEELSFKDHLEDRRRGAGRL